MQFRWERCGWGCKCARGERRSEGGSRTWPGYAAQPLLTLPLLHPACLLLLLALPQPAGAPLPAPAPPGTPPWSRGAPQSDSAPPADHSVDHMGKAGDQV